MNDIKLKTIYELLEKNFFIPSYQRGYKWEKRQIEDLLEDIFIGRISSFNREFTKKA